LAILVNVDYPAAVLEMGAVQATAHTLGFTVTTLEIRRPADIVPAFEGLKAYQPIVQPLATTSSASNRRFNPNPADPDKHIGSRESQRPLTGRRFDARLYLCR
jgi:hypothetical protein